MIHWAPLPLRLTIGLAFAVKGWQVLFVELTQRSTFFAQVGLPLSIFVGFDFWCGGVLGGWTSSPWWLCPLGRYPFGNDRDHCDLAGPHREGIHSRVCFESSPDRRIDLLDLFRVRQAFSDEVGLKGLTPIRKNNRGICGFGHHMTGVTDILIFGLQLY